MGKLKLLGVKKEAFLAIGVSLVLGLTSSAEEIALSWVQTGGGGSSDYSRAVALDSENNIFIAVQRITFPVGTLPLPNVSLIKYSPYGQKLWSREVIQSASGSVGATMVGLTGIGEIILAGWEQPQKTSAFVCKYDKEGNLLWKQASSAGSDNLPVMIGATTDREGNIVAVGTFSAGISFRRTASGPANDVYSLPQSGTQSGFIVKMDKDGNVLWLKSVAEPGAVSRVTALVTDETNNIFITGLAQGTVNIGPLTLKTSPAGDGSFAAKLAATGEPFWATRLPAHPYGIYLDARERTDDIVLDKDGNCFVSGITAVNLPDASLFVGKLDAAGNLTWSQSIGGTTPGATTALAVNGSNDLFVAASFGPYGNRNVIIRKLAGNAGWTKTFGGVREDIVTGMKLDDAGGLVFTGYFNESSRFDGITLNSAGAEDYFLAKVGPAAPVFEVEPQSSTNALNTTASFEAKVQGAAPLALQWFFNKEPIIDATNSTLVIVSVSVSSQGSYFLQASNSFGVVRSSSAQLVVNQPLIKVTTLAGDGLPGELDAANPLEARFNGPDGPSVASDGTIFVADTFGARIRYVAPSGAVGTIAGSGTTGYLNSTGTNAAFSFPNGTRVLGSGDVLVADAENDVIRRIVGTGVNAVSTFAGDGARGYVNGPAESARFAFPNDLVEGAGGIVYVSEFDNHIIRRIGVDGTVTTLAGNGSPGYQDGKGTAAAFNQPGGIALGYDGNFYVTEFSGNRIRKVTPEGAVTTLAGSGVQGYLDGPALSARFNRPNGIVADRTGNFYVTEGGNHTVRVLGTNGIVSTLAGLGIAGFADGDQSQAMFNAPGGIALLRDGSLVVADSKNNRLRRIDLNAGSPPTPALLLELVPSVTIFGESGQTYRIESVEDLGGKNWLPLTNVTLSAPVYKWVDQRPAVNNRRIYRAVRVQ